VPTPSPEARHSVPKAKPPQPILQPLAYTMAQAAFVSGRSKKQLYRDIASGLLRTYKHG